MEDIDMRQHHPLENPSLAPYGFVFPSRKKRLEYKPEANHHWVNEEKVIVRLWDRRNRKNAPRPLPVQTIIHEILPSQEKANRIINGDLQFDGLPYLTRDILVLSSVVQWFGTNVGRCFIETDISRQSIPGFHFEREFLIKFAQEMKQSDLVAFLTHTCTPHCETIRKLGFRNECWYDRNNVSLRDRAVVDGLMRWLGRKAGREFLAEFANRKQNAWAAANKRCKQVA